MCIARKGYDFSQQENYQTGIILSIQGMERKDLCCSKGFIFLLYYFFCYYELLKCCLKQLLDF